MLNIYSHFVSSISFHFCHFYGNKLTFVASEELFCFMVFLSVHAHVYEITTETKSCHSSFNNTQKKNNNQRVRDHWFLSVVWLERKKHLIIWLIYFQSSLAKVSQTHITHLLDRALVTFNYARLELYNKINWGQTYIRTDD